MGRLSPGMVVVYPGESVPELEPEPGLLHLVPSPAPSSTLPLVGSCWRFQSPLFALCLFSILNIENGQPVKLNNLDLFLMLSLAREEKRWVCQEGWQLSRGYASTF